MATSKRQYFEYIVIGCGGIGSGALYWLSKRSSSVLGLEQFSLGHERGGSQDVSRIIRLTYHDDRYTKLTPDTFKAWGQIERESGLQVVWMTGGLQLSRKGQTDAIMEKYAVAMDRNNIKYDRLSNKQLMARYPQFTVGPDIVALYQEQGGLVDAAMGNAVHIQLARGNGATILENCPATRLTRANNGNVIVHTTKGVFECRKVVVTSGGWLNSVLGTIGVHVPVTVTQEQVTYYATPHMKEFTEKKYPIWIFHCPRYDIYALPIHGNTGSKIGVDAGGNIVTADTRTFEPDPARERICTELLQEICPKFLGPILQTKTCLYTMTPDRNFVVDTCAYKGWSDVIVCCGAGHAYKFASLLGKILSELAVDGRTQYDISQFNITRDAIQDPTFKPTFFMGSGVEAKL
ncbi:monomeric sarcosine oxidase-like [Haliotis rubra]|uniref:monomeric sarcosine oxidase-like n=1 Tax=Haliotis rubra TaxID=36100 RepID=UPI001EE62F35|nr:monomeric sarcosine oxidase-like [Haliotis rubra]